MLPMPATLNVQACGAPQPNSSALTGMRSPPVKVNTDRLCR